MTSYISLKQWHSRLFPLIFISVFMLVTNIFSLMMMMLGCNHVAVILGAVFSLAAFVIIIALIMFFGKRKLTKWKDGNEPLQPYYSRTCNLLKQLFIGLLKFHFHFHSVRKKLAALAPILKKSGVNFKYEALEKATNYFNISNKLGGGGSGTVFKASALIQKQISAGFLCFWLTKCCFYENL